MKIKFKYAFPTLVLFGSPWCHWLVYHNLLTAWPDIDHGTAHFIGISGAILAAVVTAFTISDSNSKY